MNQGVRRNQPPPRDFSENTHLQIMREIRDQQRTNNQQIATLTDKLTQFVTAVEVMRVTQEQHARAIDGLEQREQAREKTANEHRFTLSNNIVFWVLGGISVLFGAINFIGFLVQHWK